MLLKSQPHQRSTGTSLIGMTSCYRRPEFINTQLTILEDTEAIAVFEKVEYFMDTKITPSNYGIINIPTQTLTYGDEVTLSATPHVG